MIYNVPDIIILSIIGSFDFIPLNTLAYIYSMFILQS